MTVLGKVQFLKLPISSRISKNSKNIIQVLAEPLVFVGFRKILVNLFFSKIFFDFLKFLKSSLLLDRLVVLVTFLLAKLIEVMS